jgi:acetyl esterase/lipase
VGSHESYFGDEARMRGASIPRLLDEHEHEHDQLPPFWIAQPGADKNVPQRITFALLEALQNAGAEVEYAFFPGQPHAFLYEDTPSTAQCLAQVIAYVHRQIGRIDEGR